MDYLKVSDLERLKSLLSEFSSRDSRKISGISQRFLTTEEKRSTLNMLRSKFPDLFSGLEQVNLNDDRSLLKFLSNPLNRNKIRERVLKQLPVEQQLELAEALKESAAEEKAGGQPPPQAEGVETMQSQAEAAGGPSVPSTGPGLPSAPSVPPMPRNIRYAPPPPQTPKPEIAIANKSGVVLEKPAPEAKIVTANKSGVVTEPPSAKSGLIVPGREVKRPISTSTLILPGKDYKPPSELIIANQSGVPVSTLKFQTGWRSTLKTSFSNAGIFFKKASTRLGSSLLRGAGAFGRAATAPLAPIVSGGGNLFIRGLNSGIGARQNFLNRVANARRAAGTARSSIANIGKSRGRLFFIGIFSLMFLTGAIAAFAPGPEGQPIAIAGPITGTGGIASCQFVRAKQPASYKSNLLLGYIFEASNLTGIPPSVLAAFIRVESPSSATKTDDDIRNYAASCAVSPTGALGIMQIQPPGTTSAKGDPASCEDCIDAGAKLIGKTVQNMTKADYCDPRTSIIVGSGFMLKKMDALGYKNSGKWDPAWTNDRKAINTLVNTYYGCLKYGAPVTDPKQEIKCDDPLNTEDYGEDVWTSIQNCKTTAIASCPIPNGVISTPSYQAGRESGKNNGHCDGGYGYTCNCGTSGRRAKAIDVPTNGQNVVLPKIENQDVNWRFIVGPYSVDSQEGGGFGYTFQTTLGSNIYYLDMLHLNQSALTKGSNYLSGTPIATSAIAHVHMTVGKNLSKFPVAGSDTDCDSNWLASDFMCK